MKLQTTIARLCLVATLVRPFQADAYSFLFFSSPSSGSLHQARILTAVEQSRNDKMTVKKLPGCEAITEPRGLAVDSLRKVLYVVDGNNGQGSKLYAARMFHGKTGYMGCEAPVVVAENLQSHWVAVDFRGKAFFVAGNQIWSVPSTVVSEKLDGTAVVTDAESQESSAGTTNQDGTLFADKRFQMVYNGESIKGVNTPHGLAVDGYRLFWSNGENGKADGTVASGLEDPMGATSVSKLATNLDKAYGVCLTPQRVFYTDVESNVFSTKTNGGTTLTVTDKLQKPRGCVFDGDGTVFIADEGGNKIVCFAGAAAELGPRKLSVSIDGVTAPFGLAVLLGKRNTLDKLEPYLKSSAPMSTALALALVSSMVGFMM